MSKEMKLEEDEYPEIAKRWLEGLSQAHLGSETETLSLHPLRIIHVHKDHIQCTFTVPNFLADKDGKWHIGALATLVDYVGAAAVGTTQGQIKVAVNFDISYLSPVKTQEEVEIEAKVLSHMGKLSSVIVQVRSKHDGELVALGKQRLISAKPNSTTTTSKL